MSEQAATIEEMKMQIVWGKYNVYFKEGFTPTPNYLAKHCKRLNITNTEYRLLTIIFGYGGRDGIAYPAQETLAKDMEISLRGLQSHLENLFQKGLIDIINVFDKESGLQRNNRYDLTPLLEKMEALYIAEHGTQEEQDKHVRTEKRVRKPKKSDENPQSHYPDTEHQGSKTYPDIEHQGGDDAQHQGGDDAQHHPNRIELKEPRNRIKIEDEEKAKQVSHVELSSIEIEGIENQLRLEFGEQIKKKSLEAACKKVRSNYKKGMIKVSYEGVLRAEIEKRIEQAEERRKQYQEKKESAVMEPKQKSSRSRSGRQELLPKWLDKEYKPEPFAETEETEKQRELLREALKEVGA